MYITCDFYSDKIILRKMILLDTVSYIWTVFSSIAPALNGNNVCMLALAHFGTFLKPKWFITVIILI